MEGQRLSILSVVLLLHGLQAMEDEKPQFSISGDIRLVKFIADSAKLLTATNNDTAAIYDVDEQKQLHTFEHVCAIELSPDATCMGIAAREGAKIVDAQTYKIRGSIRDKHKLRRMSFSPNNRYLADLSLTEGIKLWNRSGEEMETPDCSFQHNAVAFSPQKNKTYMAMAYDNIVQIRRAKRRMVKHELQHDKRVLSMAYNNEGSLLATGSLSGIKVWDSQTGQEKLSLPGYFEVLEVIFSPDSRYLACMIDGGRTAAVIDVQTGERLWQKSGVLQEFSPDGKYIAVVKPRESAFVPVGSNTSIISNDHAATSYAEILDVKTGQMIRRFKHDDWVIDVSFSADVKLFATTDTSDGVKVWNIGDLKIK